MFCQNCGSQIPDGAKFCEICGAPAPGAAEVAQEAVETVETVETPVEEVAQEVPSYTEPAANTYQQTYDNPSYTQPDYYAQQGGGKKGFAIASMICGIVSLVCCCLGWGILAVAVAAVVLGIIAIVKGFDGKTLAIVGLITGGIGLIMAIIWGAAGSAIGDIAEDVPIPGIENIIDEMDL